MESNQLLIFIILILGFESFFSSVKSEHFYDVNLLTNNCIKSRLLRDCRLALTKSEAFQLYAVSKGRYDCQTRLIGLQSDLTMMILNPSTKKQSALVMLEDLKNSCNNF